MKKYMDVIRLGHKSTVGMLNPGDPIVIQEKLDGANASFKSEEGRILAYSRNTELSSENNLRGFYEWTQTLNPSLLVEGVIYYGEWLVKHKLDYGENRDQFYLFDLFDETSHRYMAFTQVQLEAVRLELRLTPVFFEGEYQSFEHLMSFVGKSALGEAGEGIVVKNVEYQDPYGKQLFVKLVSEPFQEVKKQKAPKEPNSQSVENVFVSSCLTSARVEKMLHKLVDEQIIEENFGIEDMPIILKNMHHRIFDDIMKEEVDSLDQYDSKEIKRSIGKKLPAVIKDILASHSNTTPNDYY